MGKQKIGKLYLHWSKRGIAYKWGDDGEIHRFSFGQPAQTNNSRTYYDNNAPDDRPYGDDGYSAGGYDAYGAPYYEEPSRLAITWEHPWLFWLLLIVCPPLGIYALWKRNQFDALIQAAISGASLIWFIVLLIWLFSGIFSSSGDPTSPINQIDVASLTQTVAPTESALNIPIASPTPLPDEGGANTEGLMNDLGLTETPKTENSETIDTPVDDASTYVYTAPSGSGSYYHSVDVCNGTPYSNRVTLGYAKGQNLTACPQCYTSATTTTGEETAEPETYYATSSGKYYHTNQTCDGMKNAKPITAEQAIKEGKSECPTCMTAYYMTANGKNYHKSAQCSGMTGAKKVSLAEAQASGKPACQTCVLSASSSTESAMYYSTKTGTYYHKAANCTGMTGADRVTLAVAKERKQTACPTCIAKSDSGSSGSTSSGTKYYATKDGKYYHIKSTCSGMKNATSMSLTAAKKADKDPCPTCLKVTSSGSYYATKDGDYYHSDSTCSGMKDASKISLATAQKYGKSACPTCLSVPATYVYMTNSGKYYHSKSSCGGQSGAKKVAISTAKSEGKSACPVCIGGKSPTAAPTTAPGESVSRTDSNTYCYASEGNKYYHKKSDCSGMTNAKKMTIRDAKERGKSICPICKANYPLPTTEPTVYGTPGNKYYHKKSSCSGMSNATKLTLSAAKSKDLSACPVCASGTEASTTLKTIEPTCYTASSDDYYHAKRSCPLTSSPSKTTLSKAKGKGKTACPYCAGSSLDKMVFANSSGSLYHSKSACNGVQMNIKACLSEAVNKGYKPCSRCSPPKSTKKPDLPTTPVVTPAPIDDTTTS